MKLDKVRYHKLPFKRKLATDRRRTTIPGQLWHHRARGVPQSPPDQLQPSCDSVGDDSPIPITSSGLLAMASSNSIQPLTG